MRKLFMIAACVVSLSAAYSCLEAREIPARSIPVPSDVSPELKKAIEMDIAIPWSNKPANREEWKQLVGKHAAASKKTALDLLKTLEIKCEPSSIDGVTVFILEPPAIPESNMDKILIFMAEAMYEQR